MEDTILNEVRFWSIQRYFYYNVGTEYVQEKTEDGFHIREQRHVDSHKPLLISNHEL
jgi:hypothetical protein